MLEKYNLKMPHAVYSGENAMDNVTDIIRESRHLYRQGH